MISIILSFIFIQYYVKPNANKFIVIYCYFLLFSNCLLIFTLPYEIIWRKLLKIYRRKDMNVAGMEYILTLNYQIIFFFIASCNRYFNPFIKHYLQSGEFTFKRKLWDSFKKGIIDALPTFYLHFSKKATQGGTHYTRKNDPQSRFFSFFLAYSDKKQYLCSRKGL